MTSIKKMIFDYLWPNFSEDLTITWTNVHLNRLSQHDNICMCLPGTIWFSFLYVDVDDSVSTFFDKNRNYDTTVRHDIK